MSTVEKLIEPLRHSPQLPQAVRMLVQHLQSEREARERFYRDMTPDQKVEFIDGQVVMHSPARNRHLDVTQFAFNLLHNFVALKSLGSVKMEKCLCVFPRNDYEPDIVFFGNSKTECLENHTVKFPVPDLVVEVLSTSTQIRDRGIKFEDFAANGVEEYWIIDADENMLEQYVLKHNEYELRTKSSSGRLCSKVVSGFDVDIAALFDQQKNLAELRRLLQ